MGIDELEEKTGTGSVSADEDGGASQGSPANKTEDGKTSRIDAAKAFFRAMYAGEDPQALMEQGSEEAPAPQERQGGGACGSCKHLQGQLKEAEQKVADTESLYRRMAADFDNFRRRNEREKEEACGVGVRRTVDSLLPALDDLDRALMYLTPETPTEKVIESFRLVSGRIFACLEAIGVKPMVSTGEIFDPRLHEPVQQVETTEHPDGTVLSELRRGYQLNDKIIRPALVNVASNPAGHVSTSGEHQTVSGEHTKATVLDTNTTVAGEANGADAGDTAGKEAEGEPAVYDLGDSEE